MNRRRWRQLVVCACIAGAATAHTATATAAPLEPVALPSLPGSELEPNDTPATATPITSGSRMRGSLAVSDVDCYGFTASAGDRVFANTVTAGSSGGFDTELRVLDEAGNPVPGAEDDDDGSQFANASSIAGAALPASGSYCLEVRNGGTAAISQYDLYFQLRSGLALAESDATNGTPATPDSLAGGWVAGTHDQAGDVDWYALPLQAGDTVFLSMGMGTADASKAQMGLGLPQDPENPLFALGKGETPDTVAPSEAMTMTVSRSDIYFVRVASSDGASADAWTYELSATVLPSSLPSCRSYPSAEGELKDGKSIIFPIPVADAVEIRRAAVAINLEEQVMADLDISLRTPTGIELPLLNDIGSSTAGMQTQMELLLDDFAAIPPLYKTLRPLALQPAGGGRLALLANRQTQGTWSLMIKDDLLNGSTGELKAARLIFCGPEAEIPPVPPPGGGGGGGSTGDGSGTAPSQSRPQPKPAPVLSNLAIAPGEFRAAKAGPMVLAKRPKGGGALVVYESSEAVQTNFVLFELEEGRKVGGKCVRESALNATKKACIRPVKVISFVQDDSAGRNQFGFSGRVGARRLPPGEYQLQARGYATSGLVSNPVAATFEVLPPAAKEASARRG